MKRKRCGCCGDLHDPDDGYVVDKERGFICNGCLDSDEANATVFYGNDDYPHEIREYSNDTDGDFEVEWRSTDAWRGYYEPKSGIYQLMHTDCILSYSEDAEELKDFDTKLRDYCDAHDIRYARVFSRTSNVFSGGYDFFVHKEDVGRIEDFLNLYAAVADLNRTYRDPDRFAMTALTGKSGDFDKKDELLAKAAGRLFGGEDPDEVIADFKEEAKKL